MEKIKRFCERLVEKDKDVADVDSVVYWRLLGFLVLSIVIVYVIVSVLLVAARHTGIDVDRLQESEWWIYPIFIVMSIASLYGMFVLERIYIRKQRNKCKK